MILQNSFTFFSLRIESRNEEKNEYIRTPEHS